MLTENGSSSGLRYGTTSASSSEVAALGVRPQGGRQGGVQQAAAGDPEPRGEGRAGLPIALGTM